jgi:two-component system C4-dicarboxylate transport sensor histidine kinase DctB
MSQSSWASTLPRRDATDDAPGTAADGSAADDPGSDAVGAVDEALRLAELGLLTAGLIHELRQPVFAVKALAQLAESHPARAADYLPQILAQIRTVEALLGSYGDFSRRPATRREVFDLRTPVESAMVILTHRGAAAQVPIDVALPDAVAVRGSLLAVQQAVVNLGQNALDALRGVPAGRLRITVVVGAAGGVIRVEDNGPGLPAAIRAHLFEPFHTTKAAGTGLGLTISRDLVRDSGGELRLVATEAGTCWEIALPAAAHG